MLQTPYRSIDPSVLFNMVAQDINTFRRLSAIFLEITPPMIQRLEQAIRTGDLKTISIESHSLKSTSQLVGAVELSDACKEIEMLARQGQIMSLVPTVPELNVLLDAAMAEVRHSIEYFHA